MGPTRHPAHWGTKKQFVGLASRGTNLTESTDALKRLLLPTSANVSAASLRRVNNAQKNGAFICAKCNKGKKLSKGKCITAGPPCLGKCNLPQYKGDGNCDDANNNCGCGYDGGDCCSGSVKGRVVKTAYCKQC